MQFPESWLREFCNPPITTEHLAHTLTMAGLEVENLQPVAPPCSGVVVAQIKEITAHPNADKLRICTVDVGQSTVLSIVCGAVNARVGLKVPCALVDANLPPGDDGKPWRIKLGQLRGVESQGMLCSARELGLLSQANEGLLELADSAPLGQSIREHLALDDILFTLKLTPNLAHCLSIYGIAREVAALTGAPLNLPVFQSAAVQDPSRLPVKVSAPDLCGRFSGRIMRHIDAHVSTPTWMLERLLRCGQRGVNVLVDISNYVMFELGRPLHIFDLDKIHGGLEVRWAQPGETLKLLNGNTITLDANVGVVADALQAQSMAGIMGGDAASVSDDTENIYIEAAFWWPKAIAGRSRRYNFSTDAGHRFERGVDPLQTVEHIERATQLIQDICGQGQTCAGPIDDVTVNLPEVKNITLRITRAAKVIGMPVTRAQCTDVFQRLGLKIVDHPDENLLLVQPPSYRFDLDIEEDLIEEVVRMVGYEKLPVTPPLAPISALLRSEAQRDPFTVRRALASLGYQETINFSFVEERWERDFAGNTTPVKLLNPIASHMGVMRSSLLGSLIQVLKFNLDRKASAVKIFEIGRVFLRNPSVQDTGLTIAGFDQPMRVGGLCYGPLAPLQWDQADRNMDFFDVKGDLHNLFDPLQLVFKPALHPAMHPGRSASLWLDHQPIGFLGELHPQWAQAYGLPLMPILLFELELDALLRSRVPQFVALSKQQPIERDLAVIVADHVQWATVQELIQSADTQLLKSCTLFDVYKPQAAHAGMALDEKSLAVRLVFNSENATLIEKQIDDALKRVVDKLQAVLGARLRS